MKDPEPPFRPIQYLGSKLRLAKSICGIIEEVKGAGTVIDPFSGTGVVGQEFARRNWKVVTSDAMEFSNTMCRATLGIGGHPEDHLEEDWGRVLKFSSTIEYPPKWSKLLSTEQQWIEDNDGGSLLGGERLYPRRTDVSSDHKGGIKDSPWRLTEVFSGTYLGIKQCLELDALRWALEEVKAEGISDWCYDSIMTALLSSASNASYSAGKHFAQFHNTGDSPTEFHKARVISDRGLKVKEHSGEALDLIERAAETSGDGHIQLKGPMEELETGELHFDWVYADPPYTAQQYSRFYHLLESFVSPGQFRLMHNDGEATKGLIPPAEDRFQSNFSARTTVREGFSDLISLSERCQANLAVSYSTSREKNKRMVSLPDLKDILRKKFYVEEHSLDHDGYRQFNIDAAGVGDSQDILLVCTRR